MFSMIWALTTVLGAAVATEALELNKATSGDWLQAAWLHFMNRKKVIHGEQGIPEENLILWDQMMENGDLPPGYFINTAGEVVEPAEIMETYFLMDPNSFDQCEASSIHLFDEKSMVRPVFYLKKALVQLNAPGTGEELVMFNPPVKVRLLPGRGSHDHMRVESDSSGQELMAPKWTVERLENRSEVFGPKWKDTNHMRFIPFKLLIENEYEDGWE